MAALGNFGKSRLRLLVRRTSVIHDALMRYSDEYRSEVSELQRLKLNLVSIEEGTRAIGNSYDRPNSDLLVLDQLQRAAEKIIDCEERLSEVTLLRDEYQDKFQEAQAPVQALVHLNSGHSFT